MSVPDKNIKRELENPLNLTNEQLRRVKQAEAAEQHPDYFEHYAAFPVAFINTPHLPISKPTAGVEAWTHEAGGGKISLRKGVYLDSQGREKYDWAAGGVPRYLLAATLGQALQQLNSGGDGRRIDLSSSLYRFLKEHRLNNGGDTRRAVLQQLQTLFTSPMHYIKVTEQRDGQLQEIVNIQLAQKISLWLPNSSATVLEGMEPYIELSDGMIELLKTGKAAPIRLDIYAKLIKHPFAMDLLNWLSTITYYLSHKEGNVTVTYEWEELSNHFIHNYNRLRDFKAAFKKAVARILEFYPDLRIDCEHPHPTDKRKTLVVIHKSKLLISPKEQKQLGI